MPLSAFPKTFGLTELKKGFFCHNFNTRANQNYVAPLPLKDTYLPDSMTVKGRQEFDRWYEDQVTRGVEFNLRQELVAYCKSDVKLLKEGCLTFKRDFEDLAGFNPFEQMTIASACNRIFAETVWRPTLLRPNRYMFGVYEPTIPKCLWSGCCGKNTNCKVPTTTPLVLLLPHGSNTPATVASFASPALITPSKATMQLPVPCTNSMGVTGTGALPVILNGTRCIDDFWTGPWMMFTVRPRPR